MRVVAFRHVAFEGLGLIGQSLEQHGIEWEYADLLQDPSSVRLAENADGLIFMGGPMSANDELDGLRQEERLICDAAARARPVLGVCLGAQLIARALGARVYRNPSKEIGWYDIHLTADAPSDPLFSALNPVETVFHWHGETFDLPHHAIWLASSAACAHQAFRVATNIYGLQFHLEVTPGMVDDWCRQDSNCGDMQEATQPIDPGYNAQRLAELSRELFGRWCTLLSC
jgi:GMP synthase (glutamine-hydrolysing)